MYNYMPQFDTLSIFIDLVSLSLLWLISVWKFHLQTFNGYHVEGPGSGNNSSASAAENLSEPPQLNSERELQFPESFQGVFIFICNHTFKTKNSKNKIRTAELLIATWASLRIHFVRYVKSCKLIGCLECVRGQQRAISCVYGFHSLLFISLS